MTADTVLGSWRRPPLSVASVPPKSNNGTQRTGSTSNLPHMKVLSMPRLARGKALLAGIALVYALIVFTTSVTCPFASSDAPSSLPVSHTTAQAISTASSNGNASIAIALKTGAETMAARAAIQLLTFLHNEPMLLVVAERPSLSLGHLDVRDVYTDVYTRAAKRIKDGMDRRIEEERGRLDALDGNTANSEEGNAVIEIANENDGGIDAGVNNAADGAGMVELEVADISFSDKKRKRDLIRRAAVLNKESVVAGQKLKTKGWTLDAHKNLPAFQLLYETYPNADWYLMMDDDSFVFLDSLRAYLSAKNPDDKWYLGQKNRFKGCDGVKEFGKGPNFAQGGSGIVVSRGAMREMMRAIDHCIVKYRECWAGDIRVGLCMRDVGINVTHVAGFHGVPPNADFGFPDNPCERPFVFHHTTPAQIQTLYDTTRRRSLPTFADIYTHLHKDVTATDLRVMKNTDVKGKVLKGKGINMTHWEECLDGCIGERMCVGWAFDERGVCYYKKGVGKFVEKEGRWGGVLIERYQCNTH